MHGRHYFLLGILIGLAVAGQPSARGYEQPGPRQAMEGPQAMEGRVRFDLYRNYLIVARGSVGRLKGLNFLVDTGASPTVLDPRIARKLDLEQSPASIGVLNGSVQAASAIVPSLQFGPIRKDNFSVLVEDLSFVQRVLPVQIDAIVGLDVLGQSAFVIDYRSREISFGAAPALPVSLPLRLEKGLAIVDVEVNEVPAHLLVDTGASALIFFETRMPRSISDLKVSSVQRSANMSGDFDRKQVWLRSLRLGQAEFKQEPAFVVHNHSDVGEDFDGVMSPAALGITRVAVDLGRGELAFSR
jgi:predicted aspartyl protease